MPENEQLEAQKELQGNRSALQVSESMDRLAAEMAAEQSQHTIQNPEFLKQLQDPDADTDLWDWVESEVGPPLSGAHILGQRDDHYAEQQELLNRNLVERLIAERTPGRLLRDKPRLLALAQGVSGWRIDEGPQSDPRYRAPLTSRKKRVLRQVHEIITQRQSLSINSEGLSAVADATVENKSISSEEASESGVANRLGGLYR